MNNPKCDRCNKKITGSYIMDKEGTFHHMCHNPKPQTGIPTLPEDIPPKSDNPSPSKGLKEFLPQTPDELPKQPPKKLNRKKLLKLAESISKDMDRQTADEVLMEFLYSGFGQDAEVYIPAADKAKAALLAGLLEKMPNGDKPGWLKLQDRPTDYIIGYEQGISDAVQAIKEYFGSDV